MVQGTCRQMMEFCRSDGMYLSYVNLVFFVDEPRLVHESITAVFAADLE